MFYECDCTQIIIMQDKCINFCILKLQLLKIRTFENIKHGSPLY